LPVTAIRLPAVPPHRPRCCQAAAPLLHAAVPPAVPPCRRTDPGVAKPPRRCYTPPCRRAAASALSLRAWPAILPVQPPSTCN